MSRLRLVIVFAVVAIALSGCDLVSPNAAPERIAPSRVPFGLLNQTIPNTNQVRLRFKYQPVYIVDVTGQLSPSSRIVPAPPVLSTVIEQLLLGPTAIEKSAGYGSALPKNLVLVSAIVRNNLGVVNFASPLSSLPRKQQLLAVGQLVLTAYDVGATKGLVIKVAGVTQHLLMPNGTRVTLVNAKEFAALLNG